MRKIALVAVALAILAILHVPSTGAAGTEQKQAKWKCSEDAGNLVCMWKECRISFFGEDGKLALSTEGDVNGEDFIHIVQIDRGIVTSQRWMNAEGGKPKSGLRPDVFKQECVDGGQLKSLPPKVQEEFRGLYDIPAPPDDS
ncbi:MAG: hypothetical protein A2855_00780 [Candidatus Liptonbacteria bacterium RIFCSPHIGHO2_01_FULL_57_28]|uniref:Uncharacterized protein n=1 Tax=Candidatus Liptonbacteria bacterium RIFCSPHIGHO2_01_FULL_57_28 TaxID=1798647 RepID=A0A1G2CBM0_9BACT|nr:MAG: hypothetical protein A2855_00780 [Candidatus Liptonbacteria bacterium RIFCSPHIGHO2_01_FULL_57_28]